MTWYYHLNGENIGPVDAAELQRLRQGNAIAADTLVWEQGMPQWEPYQSSSAARGATATTAAPAGTHLCVECGQRFPEGDLLNYEGSWVCAACKPIFFQRIKEGAAAPGVYTLASIGKRFVAVFIDGLIIDLVFIPLGLVLGVSMIGSPSASTYHPLFSVGEWILVAAYDIFFIGKFGATPGKMLMKIKVVRASGAPMTYGRATGRYFAKILSAFTLMIGYLMAFWDDQKRALHDRLCDTRVIDNSAA